MPDLLSELAADGGVRSAWIAADAARAQPQLRVQADRLKLAVNSDLTGDEDLVCVLAQAPASAAGMLQRFRRLPYVLVLDSGSEHATPAAAGRSLLSTQPEMLMRVGADSSGAVLLAPARRLLDAPALSGQWHGPAVIETGDQPPQGDRRSERWELSEHDQLALSAIERRLARDHSDLEAARLALARSDAEVARLRASERTEALQLALALDEERAWVAVQLRRLQASRSWRLGHAAARVARRLTLRSDRGTDLPATIIRRMESGRRK